MDERIPALSYFAVDDPEQISPGDYDRITFFDAAGDDPFPYHEPFLHERRAGYTYDRFRHYGTSYLCSGYGFAAVGKDDRAGDGFFAHRIRQHVRHHYFFMGLIAHCQRATLLHFADQLSESIKTIQGQGPAQERLEPSFLRYVEDLQMQFLKFRSRAYFPEMTNQLQGRELYELWYRHLGTAALFELVDGTSQRLLENLAEAQGRRLNKIAFLGVPVSLALSFLSVLFTALGAPATYAPRPWGSWLTWGCSATFVFILAVYLVLGLLDGIPGVRALRHRLGRAGLAAWNEVRADCG